MSEVKTWAFSICVAAVVGGIVTMLLPSGKMEKVMRVVVGIFFLSCVTIPLVTVLPNISLSYEESAEAEMNQIQQNVQEKVQEQTLGQVDAYLQDTIGGVLDENEIPYEKIEISYTTLEDSSISISQVDVYLEADSENTGQAEQAGAIIAEKTGLPVFVTAEGG